MPDYQFNTNLGPAVQQGTSLGDLINTARGVQAYQQAQQVNPLVAQKAQMEVEQLQKLNPLQAQKAEEELTQAKTKTQKEKMGFAREQHHEIATSQVSLINNPLVIKAEKDPLSLTAQDKKDLTSILTRDGLNTADALGIPKDQASSLIKPFLTQAEQDPAGLRQFLKQRHIALLDASARTNAVNPSGTAVNYGSGGQTTSTNEFSAVKPGEAIPGTQYTQGLAPQVFTTETGAPGIMPGQAGGIINKPAIKPAANPPVAPRIVTPGNAPQPNVAPAGVAEAFSAKGGLQRSPDETYEAYKDRTARLGKLPTVANNAMNMANIDSIPNQEYTNNKIIKLLENKDVRVGKIAEAVANKTGGVGLNSEEQEVQKYLEQRIRQESARSNQDQASQRSAFGSFGTDKKALLNIIYNDKGNLASQRLFNQGVLKAQGNPNKPNLAAINQFENQFNQLNQDPDVAHLVGIVGNKSIEDLSKSDKQHLSQYFTGMSKSKIDDLFSKKEQLEKLARGEK